MNNDGRSGRERELARLGLYHRALLEVLEMGIISLDENDVIVTENKSALDLWGLSGSKLLGERLADSPLGIRCPELVNQVAESHKRREVPRKFQCTVEANGERRSLTLHVRPVDGSKGEQRLGTLICVENVSHHEELQTSIDRLEATGEELQSANEELETTNEELETTNEELQSLNEELENMNEELEFRTRELDSLNSRYAETLERIPLAVMVLGSDDRVQFWNSAAERLFDMRSASVVGLELSQLPIQLPLRDALVRRRGAVGESATPLLLRNQRIRVKRATLTFTVHLTPLSRDSGEPSLLLMFAPQDGGKENNNAGHTAVSKSAKPSAVKKTAKRNGRKK